MLDFKKVDIECNDFETRIISKPYCISKLINRLYRI